MDLIRLLICYGLRLQAGTETTGKPCNFNVIERCGSNRVPKWRSRAGQWLLNQEVMLFYERPGSMVKLLTKPIYFIAILTLFCCNLYGNYGTPAPVDSAPRSGGIPGSCIPAISGASQAARCHSWKEAHCLHRFGERCSCS